MAYQPTSAQRVAPIATVPISTMLNRLRGRGGYLVLVCRGGPGLVRRRAAAVARRGEGEGRGLDQIGRGARGNPRDEEGEDLRANDGAARLVEAGDRAPGVIEPADL